jgi:hypothetical protein
MGGKVIQETQASQVKLLITNNAFCIVQRATAQSKTGIFREAAAISFLISSRLSLHMFNFLKINET